MVPTQCLKLTQALQQPGVFSLRTTSMLPLTLLHLCKLVIVYRWKVSCSALCRWQRAPLLPDSGWGFCRFSSILFINQMLILGRWWWVTSFESLFHSPPPHLLNSISVHDSFCLRQFFPRFITKSMSWWKWCSEGVWTCRIISAVSLLG